MSHKTNQPNKRRRTEWEDKGPMKLVYILRGVPGTGKTTLSERIHMSFYTYGWDVTTINRDKIREQLLKSDQFKEIFGKELSYQESFSNATANTLVRDQYYQKLAGAIFDFKYNGKKSVLIIDSTHTKIADLVFTINLFKTDERYNLSCKNLHVLIITKRTIYENTHDVPEQVMKGFQREIKESDEWLKKKYPKKEKVTLL